MSRVLAIDTSQVRATVCAIEDGRLVCAASGSIEVAHSEALLPRIHELLVRAGWELSSLSALAVGVGPGSFTGIRIGCATIKALAQVLGLPVVPFSSLKALAYSVPGASNVIAMVNAYQAQVFAGWIERGGTWTEDALTATAWAASRPAAPGELVFCGSGAKLYWSELTAVSGAVLSAIEHVEPAGIVRAVSEGAPVGYQNVVANYLRASQAEAKLSALANTKGA